jgi:hypothetical protein
MHSDVQTLYLFQCGNENLFAVSHDKTGGAIPSSSCASGWLLRQEFQLGTEDSRAAPVEQEPIIRGIAAKGYYIWRDPCWAQRAAHWLRTTTPHSPKLPQGVSDGAIEDAQS